MSDYRGSSPPSPIPPPPSPTPVRQPSGVFSLDDPSGEATAYHARRGARIAVEVREELRAALGRVPNPMNKDDKGEGLLGTVCEIKTIVDTIAANQAARAKWVNLVLVVAVGFLVTSGLTALGVYLSGFHRGGDAHEQRPRQPVEAPR